MLAHFHRNHVTTFKIPPTTNNSDNNTQLHLHSRWDYRLLKRWMNVKLKLLSRKLKQWFGFKDRCDVFMSNDGKSLFQSSRNTKSTLKTNSERKKLRSKYGVRLVCLHKQQQGRHDVTQYKWSETRWKVAECISARVRLHFSLRGASPWSCEDISDQFLIFTVVKAKVIGAGEHSSGVIRAVYEAISRPCLNHNTELQWEMLIMSEFVITESYRSSQSVPTNGTHGTPLLCRLFGDKPTF